MAAGPISNPGSNTLYYELVLEANDFMATLKTAEGQALTFDQTMAIMKEQVKTLMSEFGIDAPTAIAVLKGVGGQLDLDAEALARLQAQARNTALSQVGRDMQEANFAGISLESTLRMIEGVLISMAVFQGFQVIAQTIGDALKAANDYWQALQNIAAAQSSLAQQGINVTNQQMLDIVDQLHQKWQTISQTDITAAVAQAGLMASEYHLSVEQMTQLANEAAILHQLDPSKPMADYVTQLAKALEGGRSLAINGEQIAITNGELLDKAKQLNLVAQDYKGSLTDQQKVIAGLAIEYDRLNPEQQKLLENQNSLLGQSEKLSAVWHDFLLQIGTLLGPVGALIKVSLIDNIQQWSKDVQMAEEVFLKFEAAALTGWTVINEVTKGHLTILSQISTVYDSILQKIQATLNAATTLGGVNLGNTAVNPAGGDVTGASSIDESKLQSILDSLAKDYQSYYDSVQKATEAFDTRMQDLQDRYNLDVQKTEEDYALRVQNEKEDFRLKELQLEQDFQLKMKELKARFELDLEDALRKRDAEAVIKDIERYNNEKTAAQQEEALRLQQMKEEEQLKLKQMKEEEQLRLKQLAEEFQLQQAEAQRAYQQQLNDLTQALDQKLQEEAVKAQQDLGLNQTSIDSIYKLFTEYYGANGKFAQEQQSAYTQMILQSQGWVDQMALIMQQYAAVVSGMGSVAAPYGTVGEGSNAGGYGSPAAPAQSAPGGPTSPPIGNYASGGMALAASATTVTFGEAGPELAMFLPLNTAGSPQIGGLAGGGGGGFGGRATIVLQLTQDLEARLVNTTLTHAAIQIERVYRSH